MDEPQSVRNRTSKSEVCYYGGHCVNKVFEKMQWGDLLLFHWAVPVLLIVLCCAEPQINNNNYQSSVNDPYSPTSNQYNSFSNAGNPANPTPGPNNYPQNNQYNNPPYNSPTPNPQINNVGSNGPPYQGDLNSGQPDQYNPNVGPVYNGINGNDPYNPGGYIPQQQIEAFLNQVDNLANKQCTANVQAQWEYETNVNEATQLQAVSKLGTREPQPI